MYEARHPRLQLVCFPSSLKQFTVTIRTYNYSVVQKGVHVWFMYASCMVRVWFVYGSCMVHVWLVYGSCMGFMYGSCMVINSTIGNSVYFLAFLSYFLPIFLWYDALNTLFLDCAINFLVYQYSYLHCASIPLNGNRFLGQVVSPSSFFSHNSVFFFLTCIFIFFFNLKSL